MEMGIGRRLRSALMVLALGTGIVAAGSARANEIDPSTALPIVFVHGFVGSAAQYASVAKRFVSNGHPADRIRAFEYDSSASIAAEPGRPAGSGREQLARAMAVLASPAP